MSPQKTKTNKFRRPVFLVFGLSFPKVISKIILGNSIGCVFFYKKYVMLIGLAPMDGVTDCPYRSIVKKIFDKYGDGELGLWTEFMSADGYFHNPTKLIHHLIYTDFEKRLIAQIYGGNIETLSHTLSDISTKYDFFGFELNVGCPSPKVMACGGGAGMLCDKKQTLEYIKTLSKISKKPFSIKTRIGLNSSDRDEQFEFLKEVSKHVSCITVHGRYYKQSHSGEVDRNYIYDLKNNVGDSCLIYGNGGIKSYEDIIEKKGNLDGILVGQAAIGNPRVLVKHNPNIDEIFDVIFTHINLAYNYENYLNQNMNFIEKFIMQKGQDLFFDNLNDLSKDDSRGAVEIRKHIFNYVVGLENCKEFKINISKIRNFNDLYEECKNYYKSFTQSVL